MDKREETIPSPQVYRQRTAFYNDFIRALYERIGQKPAILHKPRRGNEAELFTYYDDLDLMIYEFNAECVRLYGNQQNVSF